MKLKIVLFLFLMIFLLSSPTTYTNEDKSIRIEISNKENKEFDMFITNLKELNLKSKVRYINNNYVFMYSDLDKKVCRLKVDIQEEKLDIKIIECFDKNLEDTFKKIN